MRCDLIRHELRLLGPFGLALPVLVELAFLALAVVTALDHVGSAQSARLLIASLEVGLPLVAGIAAVTAVAREPAVELQLTFRMSYRATVLRRLALLTGWSALVAAVSATALAAVGRWALPGSFIVGQLSWVAPLLWFVAVGAAVVLLLRSRAASTAILGGMWVSSNLVTVFYLPSDWSHLWMLFATTHSPGADFWLANRLTITLTSLLILVGVWLLLGRTEALVGGVDA